MKAAAVVLLVCGAWFGTPVHAHVRSQSHSVWEINGRTVDVVVTIPDIEAKRLGSDASPVTPERLRDYLTQRTYAVAGGKRCALVPPVEILSALAGFSKFDFTFKCDTAANLQIHSGAFFDLVSSHTNFAQVQNAATGEFTEQLITNEHQTIDVTGGAGRPSQERQLLRVHPHGDDAHLHRRRPHVVSSWAWC